MAKKEKKQKSTAEAHKEPESVVEAHKMIESLRSRASTEQLAFFNVSTASILLVLRTALLLNGGSIIALPPFLTFFANKGNLSIGLVALSSFLFFLGIISAVYASFLNYRNYMYGMDWVGSRWEGEIKYIKDEYLGDDYSGTLLNSLLSRSRGEALCKMICLYRIGLFLIFLSYAFFVLGYIVAVFVFTVR